ncbi:MAG: multiheme c-type cytochrome [Fuerstiella sp.]|nr:multiheme c-type cytochrome [Fuerstiella sp.]
MSRSEAIRNAATLVCALAGIAYLTIFLNRGTTRQVDAETPHAEKGSAEQQSTDDIASSAAAPIWEKWPRPQLALLLTGEQHGYFEPCGCTSSQLGGMSRRADLAQKLKAAGWTVRGLDVGGLSRRTTRQAQIKFETTLAALRELDYVAIGLGPEELRMQPDFLLSQHVPPLHFLSANLEFFGVPDLGTPLPSAVFEAGGLQIGITSVMSEELQKEVLPHPDITWKAPGPALTDVIADFDDRNVSLRVLLSQASVTESDALAEQFPSFDVVLTAQGTSDPDPKAPLKKIGDTLVIETGRKGKYAGVLGVYPDDTETPFRYKLISLEQENFGETQSMITLMQVYQQRLESEEIALTDAVGAPHPSGATFVGADTCGTCHENAMDIWKETGHAHALESLDPDNNRDGHERLNGVKRTYDPECLACHVTGWDPHEYIRFQSGFLNKKFAADDDEKMLHKLMAGTQCENCHGPGSRHIELVEADDLAAAAQEVRVTLEQARKNVCEKCHDLDNSPDFDFEEYWERVKHYEKD